MSHRPSVIAALLALLATPVSAGNVIDPYTLFPATGAVSFPYAMDMEPNLYLQAGSTGLTDGTAFTLAFAHEIRASDFVSATRYTLLATNSSSLLIRFTNFTGTATARPLSIAFSQAGGTAIWHFLTTETYTTGSKISVMISYSGVGTGQVYVNGVAATPTSVTDNGGTHGMNKTDFRIGMNTTGADPSGGRFSSVWYCDSEITPSTSWSSFFDGSNNPIDSANGCDFYTKMDDLDTDGAHSVTFTAPNGAPTVESW